MLRFSVVLLFLFNQGLFAYSQHPSITYTEVPNWVTLVDDTSEKIDVSQNGGAYYQLIDIQKNLELQQNYSHYTIELLTSDGVQNYSDLSFSFDPSYQTLELHKIQILRGGQIINKLDKSKVKVLQREKGMDNHLYDGKLSVVLNLDDVRVGDVIDYAFSLNGYNPVYNNKFHVNFYQNYQDGIGYKFIRIIYAKDRNLQMKYNNGAEHPREEILGNFKELIWEVRFPKPQLYDTNVPSWYDPFKYVEVTEYKSWKEVVEWALPMYQLEAETIKEIEKRAKALFTEGNQDNQILAAIKFVQNDIRYLGLEAGMHNVKPHNPVEVLDQRYGDCKDKSLLLVAFLNSIKVEAYPVLVNSTLKHEIENRSPSPNVFNHCVVQIIKDGNSYYIDPTINDQGGDLANREFPHYEQGLILKEETKGIEILDAAVLAKIRIYESFDVSEDGKTTYYVSTIYYGQRADAIRSYIKDQTIAEINRDYLNYYSSMYPNIKLDQDVKIIDDKVSSYNEITMEEHYIIDNIWETLESDNDIVYFKTISLVINNLLNYSHTADREMPYYIGLKESVSQSIVIYFPKDWPVEEDQIKIENDAFVFNSHVSSHGKVVTMNFDYQVKNEFVSPVVAIDVIKDAEKARNEMEYTFSDNLSVQTYKTSYGIIFLVIVVFSLGAYFLRKLNREYNPKPYQVDTYGQDIGGWLMLVAFGLVLTPFAISFQFFSEQNYFNANLLSALIDGSKSSFRPAMFIMLIIEVIYNSGLIIFSSFLVIMFFKRRTNTPRLMQIYLLASLGMMVFEAIYIEAFLSDLFNESDSFSTYSDIARSALGAAIWVPYFIKSQRVKETFVVIPKGYY